jgi:predicted transposase YbfD/YdcC
LHGLQSNRDAEFFATCVLQVWLKRPGQGLLNSSRSGKTSVSTEYLITSLDRDRVTLAQIETCRRGHWTVENIIHYTRDESFGEDRPQARAGNAPQALAALRNAVAALLRIEG